MMTYQLLPTGEGARPLKNMTGGGRPTLFAVFGDFRQNGPATTFFPNKLRLSFKFWKYDDFADLQFLFVFFDTAYLGK